MRFIQALSPLANLQILNLAYNQINNPTREFSEALASFASLNTLDITNNTMGMHFSGELFDLGPILDCVTELLGLHTFFYEENNFFTRNYSLELDAIEQRLSKNIQKYHDLPNKLREMEVDCVVTNWDDGTTTTKGNHILSIDDLMFLRACDNQNLWKVCKQMKDI